MHFLLQSEIFVSLLQTTYFAMQMENFKQSLNTATTDNEFQNT